MFSRKNRAERTAEQAWEYLSSAMSAAGESAREAGRQTAGLAGDLADKANEKARKANQKAQKVNKKAGRKGQELAGRASGVGDEAWSRANAAAAALAGRKPSRSWGLIAGSALVGIALGWVVSSAAKAALTRQNAAEEQELTDTAIVVTPAREV